MRSRINKSRSWWVGAPVIIACGFQGINEQSDVTTLGRGGSDLTAVALAAALKADRCIIFTSRRRSRNAAAAITAGKTPAA